MYSIDCKEMLKGSLMIDLLIIESHCYNWISFLPLYVGVARFYVCFEQDFDVMFSF